MARGGSPLVWEGMDARNYEASARVDSDRQFRAASRHSRRVRLLRWAVPTSIVLLLAIIVLATWFNPLRMLAKLPIDPSKMLISGTKITMEAPRIAGFTRDGRPYEFTAKAAAQDLIKPDVLELKDIRAKLAMQDKAKVDMTAVSGLYNSKTDLLTLTEDIRLASTSGYSAVLSEAVMDVNKGNVVSEHPVIVYLLNGTLNANRLEVVNNGEVIRFDNGVTMNLMLNQSANGRSAQGSTGQAVAAETVPQQ
jgi:lipopolysaccharide export system protein LptC